jgi:hypothetical protein
LSIDLNPGPATRRVGVEHEYAVWSGSTQLDFRRLLPAVTDGLRALDPGDPRACRLPSGVMLTADGREAELATPPLPWDGSAPGRLDALLATERSVLAARVADVADADRVTGFSTHVSVTVPDQLVVDVGRQFVRHCGLATALVAEPRSSSGLLVRPRRGRLEIGGEYAEGEHLVAMVTFVGSAVSALLADVRPPRLPQPVAVPAREKFGWFLPPEMTYADLLEQGRAAHAGLLEAAWAWARPSCLRDGVDPTPVDRLAAGARLRLEDQHTPADACTIRSEPGDVGSTGRRTGPRRLAGEVEAETLWLTWQYVVWVFGDGRRTVHAVLPVDQEPEFLTRLDAGEYDEVVRRELGRRLGRRRLVVHAQLGDAAWWHDVRPGALVPAERTSEGDVPRVSYRWAARQLRAAGRAAR